MRTKTRTTLLALAGAALLGLAGAPAASADYQFLGTWGAEDIQDVTTSTDGSRVYVLGGLGAVYPADSRGIKVFTRDGQFVTRWANSENDFRFVQPHALERGKDGKLYLLDTGDVKILDPDTGQELQSFDVNGSFPVNPTGLAPAADGSFYVFHPGYHNGENHPDNRPPQVIHFDAGGHELQRWGSSGDGDGQFHLGGAQSIAVAADGNVLVADSWQKRIQRFSPSGQFLGVWSSLGACTGNDDVMSAWDITADPAGGAYIASFDSRVVHFGPDGQATDVLGTHGSNPGQFVFPGTLDVDRDGTLTVNDSYNDRIQRFKHVAGSPGCDGQSPGGEGGGSPSPGSPPPTPGGGEGGGPASTEAGAQFGVIGVGDITAPALGLTPVSGGGIRDVAFEATCSEDCTVVAKPRATIDAGRRSRTVDMPEITKSVAAGTRERVNLDPSDELVAAIYQALTTRGGGADVRVSLDVTDASGNLRNGSVEIELGWARR